MLNIYQNVYRIAIATFPQIIIMIVGMASSLKR